MGRGGIRGSILVALLVLVSGCSPIIGLIVRAARGGGGGDIHPGERVSGSTEGANDAWQPSCGGPDGGGDHAYVFVPERGGTYRAEVNAGYDSVVAIFDDEQAPVACNDDTGSTAHSLVEARLEAGRRYVIVVDGYRGATGTYELSLEALALDDAPVEPPPDAPLAPNALALDQPRQGDTSGGTDHRTPPCGSTPGSPDDAWTFTPPQTGSYQVHLDSSFDGVLAIYPRTSSADTPLECNDDFGSTRASRVITTLAAGTTYDVFVDGYHGASGAYTIGVTAVGPGVGTGPGPAPSTRRLALGRPVRGDTRQSGDSRAPGCGSQPGTPDEAWSFTPPRTASYQLHVDSEFDGVLAIYEQGNVLECNDDFGTTRASRITRRLTAGVTYEVVVDGFGSNTGPYTLQATEITSQGGGAIALGQSVQGNTAARSDTLTPSCGARAGSPDEVWTFTAPANGVYQVDVDADYDSVVAVLETGGRELACNDDFGGSTRRSHVETSLTAGQNVTIVVDGYSGGNGTYRLLVSPAATPPAAPAPVGVENITALERRCAAAPTLAPGVTSGTVSGAAAHARTSCGGGGGSDAVYTIQVQQPSTLRVQAESALRPILELRAGCSRSHATVACDAAANDPQRAIVHARLVPGTTYTLVLDTQLAGDGAFTLDVAITPDAVPADGPTAAPTPAPQPGLL